MPFEHPPIPEESKVLSTLERYGLVKGRFLLNPNGISLGKRYDVMREAIQVLRRMREFSDVVLVTAGRERDRTILDVELERNGAAIYLGNLAHNQLLCLMKAAMFTVVLSEKEAISRAALELYFLHKNQISFAFL